MIRSFAASVTALIVALATLACVGSTVWASEPCAGMAIAMTASTDRAMDDCTHAPAAMTCAASCLVIGATAEILPRPRVARRPPPAPGLPDAAEGVRPTPSTPPPRPLLV